MLAPPKLSNSRSFNSNPVDLPTIAPIVQDYQCFIFHDVDLLPEDDRNLYTCPIQPRHMSVSIDSFLYRLPYDDIFGGVSALTVDQFQVTSWVNLILWPILILFLSQLVNGFSNMFWGWGGEDDDMANRLRIKKLFISRYPANIARYVIVGTVHE